MLGRLVHLLLRVYWKVNRPFVAAFAETVLGYGEGPFEVRGREVWARFDRFLRQVTPAVSSFITMGLVVLPLYVPRTLPRSAVGRVLVQVWYGLKSFFLRILFVIRRPPGRTRMVETMYRRLIAQAPAQADDLVKTIASLTSFKWALSSAYLDQPQLWEALGYRPFVHRSFDPPSGPDLESPPISPSLLLLRERAATPRQVATKPAGRTTYTVIGSGAGGAVAAQRIAELDPGARVVLLEAGPLPASNRFPRHFLDASAGLYMNAGVTLSEDMQTMFVQGRAVGGSTVVYHTVAFKPEGFWWRENLVERWRALGVELDWEELHSCYDPWLERLDVGPVEDEVMSRSARTVKAGLEALGRGPVFASPTAVDRCVGCGRCFYGCPYSASRSMLETAVPDFVAAGGLLVPEAKAVRLELAPGRLARHRVAAVWVVDRDGKPVRIETDRCVIAPGAYAASKLLWRSGFTGAAAGVRTVGKRFSANLGIQLVGVFPEPQGGFSSQPIAYALEVPEERLLIETTFAPPGAIGQSLPFWGEAFQQRVRKLDRVAFAVVIADSTGYGQIKRGLLGESGFVIDFKLIERDWIRFQKGLALTARAMFEQGAEEVWLNRFDAAPLAPDGDLERYFAGLGPADFITLISGHLQGGNVIGPRPHAGVVDGDLKVYGFDNAWICDASVIPAPITLNIALTVMALASYAAPRIVRADA